MIEIPRALARQFRAVLRRSMMEGRSDWPLVLCRTDERGLTLEAKQGDVAVRYEREGRHNPAVIAIRSSVLAEFEGRNDGTVALEQIAFGKGHARWDDGGVPRVIEFEMVTPESVPSFPATPKRFTAQPAELLHALDAAARTTARESGHLALSRMQFKGRNGKVAATDGRQLLLQGGFSFPWSEDLLVPRVLAFGGRDLATDDQSVGAGRTDSHVAVRAGPWLFLLAIDMYSRFPDVQAVLPRPSRAVTRLHLDPDDAAFLVDALPKLPGRDDEHSPITLDLRPTVAVRARAEGAGQATEVALTRSVCSRPVVQLSTDRSFLLRAIKLGFSEVSVFKPDTPLLCRDQTRSYVWMPLGKDSAIPAGPDMLRIVSAEGKPTTPPTPTERRRAPMPAPRNPNTDPGGNGSPSPDRNGGIMELIEEAEAIRMMLQEAGARTARLIAALKQQRRQSRAVQQAMASLRQLQLDR